MVGCRVRNWEIGTGIYTLICIKWITHKNLLHKKIQKKKDIIVSVDKKEEKLETSFILGANIKCTATLENSLAVPQSVKHRVTT